MLHLLVALATALAFSAGFVSPAHAQGNGVFHHGVPVTLSSNDGGDNIVGGGPPGQGHP
ncbi:MAG TPA: hypothetical protein VGD01_09415 [Candidatus Elarobacter sp.]|jgi:hypothetical protein